MLLLLLLLLLPSSLLSSLLMNFFIVERLPCCRIQRVEKQGAHAMRLDVDAVIPPALGCAT